MKASKITKHRVFITDAHPVVRHGLTQLINAQTDLTVCGAAEDGTMTLKSLPVAKPDMLMVEVTFRKADGLELIKHLGALRPDLPILVFSAQDEYLFAERALRAGAKGYLRKQADLESVLAGIRTVLKGDVFVSPSMRTKLIHACADGTHVAVSPLHQLSDRELEVFRLLGKGCGTRQIAIEMNLSVSTVETYRANIKQKLQLANSSELLKQAIQWANLEGSV